MILFYLMLIGPLLTYTLVSRTTRREYANRAAITCFFIILFIILILRSESTGIDLENYKYYFNLIAESGWNRIFSFNLEPGYVLLNKLTSVIFNDFRFFMIIVAAITVFPMMSIYRKNTRNAGIEIVIFINMSTFIMMFSGLRQAIAISLGLVALSYAQERKLVKFILIILFAMTFHLSAFMLFFIYPIYHHKLRKQSLWIIVPAIVLIFIFNRQIFTLLTMLLPSAYSDATLSFSNAFTMIILLVIFVAYSFIIPDEGSLDKTGKGLRNLLLFSLVLQLFAPVHNTAMRMNYYYLVFIPLLLPRVMESRKDRWANITELSKFVILLFFTVYFFYYAYTSTGSLHVFPYHFFWENV